jgi:hypothetical protein
MERAVNLPLLKKPSAYLPLLMSLAALAIALLRVGIVGTAREADEGAAAHFFQLLVAGQVLVVGYFALRWLPTAPRQAIFVLVLQALAVLLACAPVAALGL